MLQLVHCSYLNALVDKMNRKQLRRHVFPRVGIVCIEVNICPHIQKEYVPTDISTVISTNIVSY